MRDAYRMDESSCVNELIDQLDLTPELSQKIEALAQQLIERVRAQAGQKSGIEAFMRHYDLSTDEGIVLMCIAEALLRIPDVETENLLIRDKLMGANWRRHLGKSESRFVNWATRGLVFTGKILKTPEEGYFKNLWQNLIRKSGEPIIRKAVCEAIKLLGEQFVLGRTIEEALKNSKPYEEKGYSFSYDMLGEAAKTQEDAERYFQAYKNSIEALGQSHNGEFSFHGPSISVKLSALYPRYEFIKNKLVVSYLSDRMFELCFLAKKMKISVCIDAEEADKLEMSLAIFENVFKRPELQDWPGLGLAVQAYQKRAYYLIERLIQLARDVGKKIPLRLVKGAYWDTEIKLSQVGGFSDYPVFTRKVNTDVSYLSCAKLMLSAPDAFYSQFATHNAYSIAAILTMMGNYSAVDFEFQNLQGMGKDLHNILVDKLQFGISSRIYAPVGVYEDLLPYLVRRLLENGANSSFVNQLEDDQVSINMLLQNPVEKIREYPSISHSKIPLPRNLFGSQRKNSAGVDISHFNELEKLNQEIDEAMKNKNWTAFPLRDSEAKNREKIIITNPTDRSEIVGDCFISTQADIEKALENAKKSYPTWNALSLEARADILQKMADLLEKNRGTLVAMAIKEAGKVLPDSLAEVREAVDFCRYYAAMGLETLSPKTLQGPTGESNELRTEGRGVMVCISPWNFPIAIFTGQIAAALMAGNSVISKPAEQTPLVAAFIVELFHEAGVPQEVLQLLPGTGEKVGAKLVSDSRISGVLFTGSTDTAQLINQSLAARTGPLATLIAETGGLNAMIADSTALPEQLVTDVVASAFGSAGQRCSALRILFLQEEIADRVIKMLQGAMAEIMVGNPQLLETDVGPVIDEDAKAALIKHAEKMQQEAKLIFRVENRDELNKGSFFLPQAYELSDIHLLEKEVFGPILHVVRFKRENLAKIIDEINSKGYALTFGVHSRIQETIDFIAKRIHAGNIYINRNIIGAVVGVQPFGGHGLSGTGPKAGGPHYLLRLCNEISMANNIVAMGGNTTLLTLTE